MGQVCEKNCGRDIINVIIENDLRQGKLFLCRIVHIFCDSIIYVGDGKMEYLKLMRVKHYVKNVLVFIPLFFNRTFFNLDDLAQIIMGFICFSMISSAVYILNDIRDVEKDKNHPKKKMRPIASGRVSKRKAIILLIVCILVATIISGLFLKKSSIIFLALYFVLNVIYSMGLKNYPIIDVVILASGFVIRVLYGGALVGIEILSGFI